MPTNPYATHLGDRDPRIVLPATAAALRDVLARIGATRSLVSPAPGKWSARDILVHLADTELVFGFRLRQALADDDHVIQPYDQQRWTRGSLAQDAELALATFGAVRAWNVAWIRALPAAAFHRRLTHPERGTMTIQTVVETMAGHDLNHLNQLEAIAACIRD